MESLHPPTTIKCEPSSSLNLDDTHSLGELSSPANSVHDDWEHPNDDIDMEDIEENEVKDVNVTQSTNALSLSLGSVPPFSPSSAVAETALPEEEEPGHIPPLPVEPGYIRSRATQSTSESYSKEDKEELTEQILTFHKTNGGDPADSDEESLPEDEERVYRDHSPWAPSTPERKYSTPPISHSPVSHANSHTTVPASNRTRAHEEQTIPFQPIISAVVEEEEYEDDDSTYESEEESYGDDKVIRQDPLSSILDAAQYAELGNAVVQHVKDQMSSGFQNIFGPSAMACGILPEPETGRGVPSSVSFDQADPVVHEISEIRIPRNSPAPEIQDKPVVPILRNAGAKSPVNYHVSPADAADEGPPKGDWWLQKELERRHSLRKKDDEKEQEHTKNDDEKKEDEPGYIRRLDPPMTSGHVCMPSESEIPAPVGQNHRNDSLEKAVVAPVPEGKSLPAKDSPIRISPLHVKKKIAEDMGQESKGRTAVEDVSSVESSQWRRVQAIESNLRTPVDPPLRRDTPATPQGEPPSLRIMGVVSAEVDMDDEEEPPSLGLSRANSKKLATPKPSFDEDDEPPRLSSKQPDEQSFKEDSATEELIKGLDNMVDELETMSRQRKQSYDSNPPKRVDPVIQDTSAAHIDVPRLLNIKHIASIPREIIPVDSQSQTSRSLASPMELAIRMSLDPDGVSDDKPIMLASLDSEVGIPKGDCLLSLLKESVDTTWSSRVLECVTRNRTVRQFNDTRWVQMKALKRAGIGSFDRVEAHDVPKLVEGDKNIMQKVALEHLKYDELDDAFLLYEKILRQYEMYHEFWASSHDTRSAGRLADLKPCLGSALHNVGILHLLRGEFSDALECFEKATSSRLSAYGASHPDHLSSLSRVALCRVACGDIEQATNDLNTALVLIRTKLRSLADYRQMAEIENNLGCLAQTDGKVEDAMKFFSESLKAHVTVSEHSMYAGSKFSGHSAALNQSVTKANIGFVYLLSRKLPASIDSLEYALREQHVLLRDAHTTLIATMDHLSVANYLSGKKDKAQQILRRMYHIQADAHGADDWRPRSTAKRLDDLAKENDKVNRTSNNSENKKKNSIRKVFKSKKK